ncbi:hypothetical protein RN001_015202 [Aquatica leii]|uniref:Uncharacterized protein n=1 Tax=Aquatica leii TaxID=1421715 RepID=A0AAN7P1H4_9COLE|nr:hypothetical protein RN001_015202 [Aquatica leii]
MYQKSIQNIQRKAKLEFGSVTLEDQGRYICTSLKYHTSRILYIIVKAKNQTEQYFRRKRDLTETPIDIAFADKTNLYDNSNVLPLMFSKGSFNLRPHVMFIMIALFLISLMIIFAFVVKLCSRCKTPENRKIMQQAKVYSVSVGSMPNTRLYENF